jgi:hypothetical protein
VLLFFGGKKKENGFLSKKKTNSRFSVIVLFSPSDYLSFSRDTPTGKSQILAIRFWLLESNLFPPSSENLKNNFLVKLKNSDIKMIPSALPNIYFKSLRNM